MPQWGGFCAYGISNELDANATKGMDVARATEGWPWARDYLGPPGNPDSWLVRDGRLFLTFFAGPLAAFEADFDASVARGDARWAEWFGSAASAPSASRGGGAAARADVYGPFNSDCLAASYGPPVSRTCCLEPQKLEGIASARPVQDECLDALARACGGRQGDNPVSRSGGKCSACLEANFTLLADDCGATDTAVHALVDKVFCW